MLVRSTRDRAVHALRTTTLPQSRGHLFRLFGTGDTPPGYCALGAIAHDVGGVPLGKHHWLDHAGARAATLAADAWLTEHFGHALMRDIARRYDRGASYAQIADWLDTLPVDDVPDFVPDEWVQEVATR